uniref:Uncharacterized protein n=1 Tax=Arundo donax TaxID=35708 RepID=A0A0A9C870_ARUDO
MIKLLVLSVIPYTNQPPETPSLVDYWANTNSWHAR